MNRKGNFYNPQNVEIENYMDGYFWACVGSILLFTSIPLDQTQSDFGRSNDCCRFWGKHTVFCWFYVTVPHGMAMAYM